MTLAEFRARARQDLQDTNPADQRWTDAEIDAAIQRAVWEYSQASPLQQQTNIPTTSGSSELNIAALSSLVHIESVEFPIGETPPHFQLTHMWAGRLFMEDRGDGRNAIVRWGRLHTVDASPTTIPAHHRELVILGATAYLAMSASAFTVDRATIAGRYGTTNYKQWGKERLERFDNRLKDIALHNRVISKQLYTE